MTRQKKTMDGNMAAAYVSYAFTESAVIYPITPSSPMADYTDIWAKQKKENIFGQPVQLTQMQSEAGVAGAMHGSLQAGALTTTYTASQGLLLMLPNLYKMAGEQLPGVFHVSARTIASHALSIFGDQSDIYACRQTGVAMLCAGNVQEVMDLGAVAHLAAIKGRIPFIHFFDGFRTSHELQKIELWDYKDLAQMCDFQAIAGFREKALNPEHPFTVGTAQNPDVFFQMREASNQYYENLIPIVEDYMKQVNEKIGTNYQLFQYYGAKDATKVIIAMGSVCDTIEETIDCLAEQGEKAGLIKVRLYRPFSKKHLLEALPSTVEQIIVLNKTKEPGGAGEPLYLDVLAALKGTKFEQVPVFSGRYGLSSKDTLPGHIKAALENREKVQFTLGIKDDVTGLSLDKQEVGDKIGEGIYNCKFWGLGSDGTVGANKNSIKIIGDHTDLYVQAYFDYDSKKSGGLTVSHLRFGKRPIKSAYLVDKGDFVACHKPSYVNQYPVLEDVKEGGIFLLNTSLKEQELEQALPGKVKRLLARKKIRFYIIDGFSIGKALGLGNRINTILQAAFFKLTGIIPIEDARKYMKEAAQNSYASKGEDIVAMNWKGIDAGMEAAQQVQVPEEWGMDEEQLEEKSGEKEDRNATELGSYVNQIQNPVYRMEGNNLPVSVFTKYADGKVPNGSAAYEKRGIALEVPEWIPENCIQCNFCSFVCPHATIRPVIVEKDSEICNKMEKNYKSLDAMGMADCKFAVTISPLDCTGCGSCASICPGKKGQKALRMMPMEEQLASQDIFNETCHRSVPEKVLEHFKPSTIKGSQLRQPLLEFSGACGGCGETPYAKLLTQLFGDSMYIANATGCSSIWGASFPSTPYTKNAEGKGPAWANSLFEDNAEFGYGMVLAERVRRSPILECAKKLSGQSLPETLAKAMREYLDTADSSHGNREAGKIFLQELEQWNENNSYKEYILENREYVTKKSHWIIGGDGWAYDIGYGGLDHVLASNANVNVLVFDTEVYSNTGGQASKATPTLAVAQFAAGGKETAKKDLGAIAMAYGYVYVAQIALGANLNQTLKAITEAESYPGPSLIIAYAPCINHGITGGLRNGLLSQKQAVESGYWNLYRYDPRKTGQGQNPLQLDSKGATMELEEFIQSQVRFRVLKNSDKSRYDLLCKKLKKEVRDKQEQLEKRAGTDEEKEEIHVQKLT